MKILLITIVLLASIGYATEMGDLAASMKAGTWAELQTNNIASVIEADGAMRCILPYADGGAWEPGSESFYFIGSDHQHSTGYAKFAHYSAKTNSWREMPRPSFFGALTSNAMHGYDHTAINITDGLLYHIPYRYGSSRPVYQYTISTGSWTTIPPLTGYISCCVGAEYFPEAGGLFISNAQNKSAHFFNKSTRQWGTLSSTLPTNAGYQSIAEYNPVHKVMVFGGGAGSRDIFKLDSSLTITQMKDAPCDIEVHNGCVFTLDPVSGDYLVVANTKVLYAYDIISDTWTQQPGTPPLWSDGSLWESHPVTCIVATPVSNYGVTMFVRAYRYKSAFKVYLYKHSDASPIMPLNVMDPELLQISVSPNPFRSMAKIKISAKSGFQFAKCKISIYNINGRVIKEFSPSMQSEFMWHAWNQGSGIYIVQISAGDRKFQKRILLSE